MSRKLNFHLIRQTNLLPAGFSVSHMSYCRWDIICHFSTVASLSLTHKAFPFLNYWFKSKRYSVPRPSTGLCFSITLFRVAWCVRFFLMVYILPQFWLTKTWTSQIEVFITIREYTQVHLTIHLFNIKYLWLQTIWLHQWYFWWVTYKCESWLYSYQFSFLKLNYLFVDQCQKAK